MLAESLPGSVGDYAASIGALGIDYPITSINGTTVSPDGVFRAITGVRFAEITDGLTNTLMVGEKHIPPGAYNTYPWDCGLFDGANPLCSTRAAGPSFPLAATDGDTGWKFGSAHAGAVQFVFCDGGVRPLLKSIDPVILGLLAQRDDGRPIPNY
jgi:prepilin-type processing-associated H-X9-DG protein